MQRLGLALSGGGFRATLYHLGVVRYLRDAGILSSVTHINTVSGGSILGAHLVLNWDRYTGSSEEFDEAAAEIFRFVQLDVRNKIVRRFPLAGSVNWGRSLLRRRSLRKFTRAGLLEQYYEKHLFGDIALSRLPDRPRLHILATNLSEGCLCSFNRNGMLLQRRTPGRKDRFERVEMGMATLPMAVAASSAFPGFFPPLELRGADVGADEGEFNRQAFTDGGVYDNLGLRMFRCLEQAGVREATPLGKQDFIGFEDVKAALYSAANLPDDTPLRRLWEKLKRHDNHGVLEATPENNEEGSKRLIQALWEVIRSERLYRDEAFQHVELADQSAQSLLAHAMQSRHRLDVESRLWLNRQIVEAALRQVVGRPCLKLNRQELDGILVSDAGGKFKVKQGGRGGGLIKTALRASDILMDRVWQLELEAFENTTGVLFLPITDVVETPQDRTAVHPEVQRQVAKIRTDLNRFSNVEISALVQHGYCVARKNCRAQRELGLADNPTDPPWKPLGVDLPTNETPVSPSTTMSGSRVPSADPALQTARSLRRSAQRKIWSTLLDLRDWTSYAWVAVVLILVVTGPILLVRSRDHARQQRMVLGAVADMSPDYRKILELMKSPVSPSPVGMPSIDVDTMEPVNLDGIQVLSDTRIFDLRGWSDAAEQTPAIAYNRLNVLKKDTTAKEPLRIHRVTRESDLVIQAKPRSLQPKLSRMRLEDGQFQWELSLDLGKVPAGENLDVQFDVVLPKEVASDAVDQGRLEFMIGTQTSLLEVWMLLPLYRDHEAVEVVSYPEGSPELAKIVVPHSQVEITYGSIASFRIIEPEVGHRYECRWTWSNDGVAE